MSEPDDPTRELAELTSAIAHELRGPVSSIRGLASTGTQLYDSLTDDERLEFFGLIDSEARRLGLLAEQISTALRIEAGLVTYAIRRQPLSRIVEELVWETSHGDHAMLAETDADVEAPCDVARIKEVVANLLDNAAKFSPPDAPIEVRVYQGPEPQAVVEVADRGPGIPPEEREHVFERFAGWRPAGYEETPGAGLGLFICAAHVRAHGGRIEIDDNGESGTILRFTLPIGEGST